jgi:hypothetical protein
MTGQNVLDTICGSSTIIGLADKSTSDTVYRASALGWLNLVLKDIQNRQESFHWRFLEVNLTLTLVDEQFNYDLVTAFSTIDPYKVIAVYDKTHDTPITYIDYKKFRQYIANEGNDLSDPLLWTLHQGDICLWPVNSLTAITGTTTSSGLGSYYLNDTAATFITSGVEAGMKVNNTTDGTSALVVSVDSEIRLTLDTDIMGNNKAYTVSNIVYVDYVKTITAATDNSTALDVPAKYDQVLIDGVLVYVYRLDPKLGNWVQQQAIYETGVSKMIRDNSMVIGELPKTNSHRNRLAYRSNEKRGEFPVDID